MSVTSTGSAAGIILVVLGIWLLLQTLVGNLPARIVGMGSSGTANGGGVVFGGPNYGGGPLTPGGTKIGSTLTPAQQKQIQHQLGIG